MTLSWQGVEVKTFEIPLNYEKTSGEQIGELANIDNTTLINYAKRSILFFVCHV